MMTLWNLWRPSVSRESCSAFDTKRVLINGGNIEYTRKTANFESEEESPILPYGFLVSKDHLPALPSSSENWAQKPPLGPNPLSRLRPEISRLPRLPPFLSFPLPPLLPPRSTSTLRPLEPLEVVLIPSLAVCGPYPLIRRPDYG